MVERNLYLYLLCSTFFLMMSGSVLIGMFICVIMHRIINKMKGSVQKKTLRLQKMLHLSVVIEFLIISITINIPFTVVVLITEFPMPYGSYVVNLLLTLCSFQTTLSAIAQCYFITPFKQFVLDLFYLCICKKKMNVIVIKVTVIAN